MGEEEDRKREREEAQANGNVYSRKGFCLSIVVLVLAVGTLAVAGPYIEALMTEASVSIDDGGDDDASSVKNRAATIVHRQREMAAESLAYLSDFDKLLLKAQEEEAIEDMDNDWTWTEFAPAAPPGYIKVDHYEDDYDEEEEEERSDDGKEVKKEEVKRVTSIRDPGARPRDLSSAAAGTQRASSFAVRRRRHGWKPPVEKEKEQMAAGRDLNHGQVAVAAAVQQVEATLPAAEAVSAPAAEISSVNSPQAKPAGPKKLTEGFTVVPMKGNAYNLAFVEEHGKQSGYMSNEGPVKVWEHPKWPLKKNPKWQQPQRVCPGAPKGKGTKEGEPKKRAYVRRSVLLMAEGLLQVNDTHIEENRCMFLNKDCADLDLPYGGSSALKMLKMKPEAYEQWRKNKLMDLKPRMLGSCALVANGDNLLRAKRGSDIDEHDTIFRHNTPIKGYERHVGKRQTSIMWVKGKYASGSRKSGSSNAELMYDLLLGVDKLPKSMNYRGKPLMIVNKNGGYNAMLRERIKMYAMAGAGRKNHPSGGFSRPLSLLASGLCTRVDIYGFSSRPSGKYFERSATVMPTHMMKFEHWVYRYLQSEGKLCVYGD